MLSRRLARSIPSSARGYATKVQATDFEAGKVSSLTVKVNAGSRYASKDGISHLLSRFNFQNTRSKSALRLTRETELLGGEFYSKVDRDAIYLTANFLKENLPYFVNALGDVLYKTSFRPHELPEVVLPAAKYDLTVASSNPTFKASELLHSITYRGDLGKPLYYDGVEKITLDDIKAYADKVYVKENIEIYGKGINPRDLDNFYKDSSLYGLPEGKSLLASSAPKTYEGVESRLRSTGASVAAIGVPVKVADFGTYEVLTNFLSSPLSDLSQIISDVKFNKYAQSGLFTLFVIGDAQTVSTNIKKIVTSLKKSQNISAANKYTAAQLALANDNALAPLSIDFSKVKDFKLGKYNYVAVGDVNNLPYADEL